MASIKEQPRLITRVALTNLATGDAGLGITPLLSGQHGIGKSMIVRAAAQKLNGICMTVECSQIGEGVITGLPVASKASDGSTEVTFVKYFVINKIKQLQEYYYKKAAGEGLLNGTLKLNEKEGTITYKDQVFKTKTQVERILDGEDNKYKFGEELPLEIKMELLSSGDIQFVFLFLDEINRCDAMTQKEMMNIILNRSVNGYDFPWWVSLVAAMNPVSQNSSYAVNEMDPAQLDRFLKIKVRANVGDWIDYALSKDLDNDMVAGIAIAEECFVDAKDKSLQDETEMTPSPRSWEMMANLKRYIYYFNKATIAGKPIFTPEEQQAVDQDLRTLMIGKVGQTAASTVLAAIENKENNIKPQEIFTAKEPKIDSKIVEKFNKQKSLRKKVIADSALRYIADHIDEYIKKNKSTDAKQKAEYFNFMEQIKCFVNMLDSANQLSFAKKLATSEVTTPDGKPVFGLVAKCFAKDVLQNLTEFRDSLRNLSND